MSPVNKSVNSFKAGLNLSVDNINQQKDSYSYGLNIVKEDPVNNPEIITNEKGFLRYLSYGDQYTLMGYCYLGLEDYVLFLKAPLGSDSSFNTIVLLHGSSEDSTYITIYDTPNLNFDEHFPIKATYRTNYRNERVVYFVDGNNKDRVINVDNLSLYSGDVSELSIDVEYTPAITTGRTILDDGGNLVTGTYEFYGSYKTADNATSGWFILTASPIYIIDDNTQTVSTNGNIIIDGCDSGLPTNKAIQLDISNLDNRFNTLRIGVIKTLGSVSSAVYVDNIYYSTDDIQYNYTGLSTEIIISDISELTVDNVTYFGSNTINQMNNRLLRANMSSNKIDIGYQPFANQIVTDYFISEEVASTMADTEDYNTRVDWWKSANTRYTDTKSLMRDEVYSVGVAFGLIKEGAESRVYHIPGRAINSIPAGFNYINQYNDSSTLPFSSTWDSSSITENGTTAPRWKDTNTAALSDDDAIHKLAYWESSTPYPDNLGLPITGSSTTGENNTPIRHHKMPSCGLEPIFRNTTDGSTITLYKRHLGLTFTNIVVPDTIKDNISYIRFYITPRNINQNKSIIAKGIFANCSLTKVNIGDFDTVSDTLYIQPCIPYNDQAEIFNGGCYRDGQDTGWDTINNYYHSFYSPDTLLKSPELNSDKILIENESIGIVQYYNTIAGVINIDPYNAGGDGHKDSSSNGGYKRDFFYDDSNHGRTLPTGQTSSHAVYNVTPGNFRSTYKSICILNDFSKVRSDLSRRRLKQAVYVPFNSNLSTDQIGGMDNPYISGYGAANTLLELNPSYSFLGSTEVVDTSTQFIDNDTSQNMVNPNQADDVFGTYHEHTIDNPLAVYRYGSLKFDNTGQYGTIDNITYVPTDLVIVNPTFDGSNVLEQECSGLIGDSWIDMFSVKRTRFAQKEHETFCGKPEINIGISTFFTESNINHRLRYAEGVDSREYYPKQVLTTPIKQYLDTGFNFFIFNNDNYYKENLDFNKGPTKENFGLSQLDLEVANITQYTTRILYSEPLLNESVVDSYRVFLANNYRDLPKDRGFITHLFKKGRELYAITRDSLWEVFTATETFKSNSSEVSVGTGDFLALEPIELLSIEGGHGGSSSKFSLTECSYGYFYVDKNKGKLILFRDKQSYFDNSQQVDISLIGVFGYIRNNYKLTSPAIQSFDVPLLNSGYVSGYDSELKRILVTKLDYSLTSEQQGLFEGVYDPNNSYDAGDIYTKDGVYYVFESRTSEYSIIEESGDLSDFIQGDFQNPLSIGLSSPSHGTVVNLGADVKYTPTTGYFGSDTFNVTLNCTTTEVDVDVRALPVDNYTVYAKYGMDVLSVEDDTSTGTPAGFTEVDIVDPDTLSIAYTTVTPGTIRVILDGTPTPAGHVQLFLQVGFSTVSTANVSGPGTYILTFPTTVTNPTNIIVGLQLYG